MILHLDFETRSERDLSTYGLHNYVNDPSTRAILLAYAVDDHAVRLCRPADEGLPRPLVDLITSPHVKKVAWNAGFERHVLESVFGIKVPYEEWEDPMVLARYTSMPGGLDDVGRILGLAPEMQKLEDGKRLIKMFCEPAVEGGKDTFFGPSVAAFRTAETHPADWALFEEYCKQDVVAERVIYHKLVKFAHLTPTERQVYLLDQKINDRGMPTDLELVLGSGKVADLAIAEHRAELKELTGVENPGSNEQILSFMATQGYTFGSIGKAFVNRAIAGECQLTELGKKVLEIRKQASKTSHHKLTAIRDIVSADGRLRDQFSYLGAARTGRWAGHDVQLQNLMRPTKEVEKKLERAVSLLRAADYPTIRREFSSVLDVVGSCLRTCFRASEGCEFVASDFSAVENRGIGWVARCQAILDVFLQGRDPYISFAVKMNGVPYEQMVDAAGEVMSEYKEMRQIAKPAVLGAGYQLSGGEERENEDGDVIRTGLWGYAQAMGIEMSREKAHESVAVFRKAYDEVVQCWYDLERAAIRAVRHHESTECGRCVFECRSSKLLRVILPSGRPLHYIRPLIEKQTFINRKGDEQTKDGITYEGLDQVTRVWTRVRTHGGKWMENIVQSLCRDLLADAMLRADAAGLVICGHVHDEVIAEVPKGSKTALDDLNGIMSEVPAWAGGFPMAAAGWIGEHYRK